MSSILTNSGAMVALQTLKSTNKSIAKSQNAVSTGMHINSAKDNPALWTIKEEMNSDIDGLKTVKSSLSMGTGVVSNARTAAETVANLVQQIKTRVLEATDGNLDRATLQADIEDLRSQISLTVGAAQFNGVNLLQGSIGGDPGDSSAVPPVPATPGIDTFKVMSSVVRSADGKVSTETISVDLPGNDLSLTTGLTDLAELDVNEEGIDLADALTTVEAALTTALKTASAFGNVERRIEIQSESVSKQVDALTNAVSGMVDTDMETESARIKALQTQQQLAIQSLQIANEQPQNILALFR